MRDNMQLQSHKSLGFTLIELLVGLTIISLLFGFGFVSFREFSRRQALYKVARDIMQDLRLAQQLALSGEKPPYSPCAPPKSLNGYRFAVVNSQQYAIRAYCSIGGGDVEVEVKTVNLVSSGVSISTPFPDPNPILFKVLGQGTNIPGQTAIITLAQSVTGNTATITITQGGVVK